MLVSGRPFNFLEAYVETMWCKYFRFSGRASRGEYWRYMVVQFVVSIITYLLLFLLFKNTLSDGTVTIIWDIYGLYLFLPSLGIGVRRLHDIGRSGYWIFLNLIPLIGALVLFIFSIKSGDKFANTYGEPQELQNPEHIEEIHSLGYKPYAPLVIIWVIAVIASII